MGALNYMMPRSSVFSQLTNSTCPMPTNLSEVEDPFLGNMTFYHFNMIVSGACTLLTCIIIFTLKMQHATHFSVPNEQVKIMRIINMLPAYSVLSFICICFPNSYVYFQGWTELFQGIALYAFHMLLIDFLGPTERRRDEFFGKLRVKKSFRKGQYREGLSWLKLSYYCTLQYPIVIFFCAIGQSVAQALDRYCLDSNAPAFAHIWLELIQNVSVTIAINAVIRFYANTKNYMKEHKPLMKLLSFKLMVGLIFLEQILFLVLEGSKVLKTTNQLSYADVHTGLPTMIICIQMVPFAIFIHFAFSVKPYLIKKPSGDSIEMLPEADENGRPVPRSYQGGTWGSHAWAAYLNPLELAMEVRSMYRTLHQIKVRKQPKIYKSDLEAEKLTGPDKLDEDAQERRPDSPDSIGYEQTPHDMTHHGRNDPYQQALEQSEPLMPQTAYPAQTHQTAEFYDTNQSTEYSAHPVPAVSAPSSYGTQLYDPPMNDEYQQGQWGQAQYIVPQHDQSPQHSPEHGQSPGHNGEPYR
ncbi:hypothetical protein N7456_009586 [Penicillium angulare]|uniref:Organic solute transporter Ost-alpha n=1 Tax=Penicillium angulare TaxID=116970 RepID=A0A9W9F4X7_9EURO|nr:hypothetical protein N7456_009586 [Penicillium angulare]